MYFALREQIDSWPVLVRREHQLQIGLRGRIAEDVDTNSHRSIEVLLDQWVGVKRAGRLLGDDIQSRNRRPKAQIFEGRLGHGGFGCGHVENALGVEGQRDPAPTCREWTTPLRLGNGPIHDDLPGTTTRVDIGQYQRSRTNGRRPKSVPGQLKRSLEPIKQSAASQERGGVALVDRTHDPRKRLDRRTMQAHGACLRGRRGASSDQSERHGPHPPGVQRSRSEHGPDPTICAARPDLPLRARKHRNGPR